MKGPPIPLATMRCSFDVTVVVSRRFVDVVGKTSAQASLFCKLSSWFVYISNITYTTVGHKYCMEKVVCMEVPSPNHLLQKENRFSQLLEDSYSTNGNQSPPHRTSIEVSDTHSRPDSFIESYSSESLNEDSPFTVEHQQHDCFWYINIVVY